VAQPGRALGSGPRGRRFKSFRPDQHLLRAPGFPGVFLVRLSRTFDRTAPRSTSPSIANLAAFSVDRRYCTESSACPVPRSRHAASLDRGVARRSSPHCRNRPLPVSSDPSSDARRSQQSDGLESGCHAVRSLARIVRGVSIPTPDRFPVAAQGSLAGVSSTPAGRPVPTSGRWRSPDHRRRGTDRCWYDPYLPSRGIRLPCHSESGRGRFSHVSHRSYRKHRLKRAREDAED
jgi:hypothetical protein